MFRRSFVVILAVLLAVQIIPVAYSYEGVYSDGAVQGSVSNNLAYLHIYNEEGEEIDEPLFSNIPVRCIFDGTKYTLEETILSEGCYIVSEGDGDLQNISISIISSIPIEMGITDVSSCDVTYMQVPVDGTATEVPVRDSDGHIVQPVMGHPYYLHIRVPYIANLGGSLSGNIDLSMSICADVLYHNADYVLYNSVTVTSVIESIIVESENGVVTDKGTTEGHTTAGIWADESMKDCVGIGNTTICELGIAEGTRFCIQYDANVGGWGVFGKIELTFIITYDDVDGSHTLTKTLSRDDYQGTKAKGFIGDVGGTPTTYSTLSALSGQDAWIGTTSATNIKITISGMVSEWSDTLRGYALANIILY